MTIAVCVGATFQLGRGFGRKAAVQKISRMRSGGSVDAKRPRLIE